MRFSRSAKRPLGRRGSIAGAVVAACIGVLGLTSVASAAPTGEFAQFGKCPVSKASVVTCVYSVNYGGSFTIGTKNTPVKNPVTLQGGLEQTEKGFAFVGASDGNTLSKANQPVPGGLLGITAPSWWPQILRDLFNEVVINQGATGVTATVELAKPASSIVMSPANFITGEGTALFLPVKIKLNNAFLGSSCYIGSSSSPLNLNLTTGTTSPPPPNTPISGKVGTPEANEEVTLVKLTGARLVDNSFAAPGANGCGGFLFSWAVDPLVDSILGTPSAAGKNTAILDTNLQLAQATAVRASE